MRFSTITLSIFLVLVGIALPVFTCQAQQLSVPTAIVTPAGIGIRGSIPLSQFLREGTPTVLSLQSSARGVQANSQDILATSQDVDRLQLAFRDFSQEFDSLKQKFDDLNRELDEINEKLNEVTALNAALDFQRPAPGKSYRVFTGFGQFQDKTAVGLGITGVFRDVDYGLGVSMSTNQVLTKGSVGWSF